MSDKHIAIATGFLNEPSCIEIQNIFTGQKTSTLRYHRDMIDCLWNLEIKGHNPYVRFLVSVSRDNKMIIWKIFNGKTMHTDLALPLFFANQESNRREKPLITYRSGNKIEQVDSSNEDIESNNQNYISKKKN